MGPPPVGLRDGSFRGYSARSAAYPFNAAAIPPCRRAFAPIGTSDALIASAAPKEVQLISLPVSRHAPLK